MFDFILNHLAGILQTLLLSLRVARGQGVVVPDSVVVAGEPCMKPGSAWIAPLCGFEGHAYL